MIQITHYIVIYLLCLAMLHASWIFGGKSRSSECGAVLTFFSNLLACEREHWCNHAALIAQRHEEHLQHPVADGLDCQHAQVAAHTHDAAFVSINPKRSERQPHSGIGPDPIGAEHGMKRCVGERLAIHQILISSSHAREQLDQVHDAPGLWRVHDAMQYGLVFVDLLQHLHLQ